MSRERLHIGRRFPTLRQYDQVPPVILRLFAPRRGVTRIYTRRRAAWKPLKVQKAASAEEFLSTRSIFALARGESVTSFHVTFSRDPREQEAVATNTVSIEFGNENGTARFAAVQRQREREI